MKRHPETFSPSKQKGQSGQALLETLTAVAIMAIALVSLLAGLARLQDKRLDAARARRAAFLAEGKMLDLLAAGPANLKNASGTFPAPDADYAFSVEISDTRGERLRLVSVTVRDVGSQRLQIRLARLEPGP
jgi:general secretion pathway protein I